jgi:muramidase (phage lysozyme)
MSESTAPTIVGSVGAGGQNLRGDVKTVQQLLNRARQNLLDAGAPFEAFAALDEDDILGGFTLNAIKIFQRDIVGFVHPDQRIDPGGRTWRRLVTVVGTDPGQPQSSSDTALGTDTNLSPDAAPEELLQEPRIKAMLDMIGFSEGTHDGYGVVVRGRVIGPAGSPFLGRHNVVVTDFRDHPRLLVRVNSSINSTAAGRYQFLQRTWDGLHLPDFSPRSQDLGAIMLMQRRRMIEPLLRDDFDTAVQRGSLEWASFPDAEKGGQSHFGGQPAHPLGTLRRRYQEALRRHRG